MKMTEYVDIALSDLVQYIKCTFQHTVHVSASFSGLLVIGDLKVTVC